MARIEFSGNAFALEGYGAKMRMKCTYLLDLDRHLPVYVETLAEAHGRLDDDVDLGTCKTEFRMHDTVTIREEAP